MCAGATAGSGVLPSHLLGVCLVVWTYGKAAGVGQ